MSTLNITPLSHSPLALVLMVCALGLVGLGCNEDEVSVEQEQFLIYEVDPSSGVYQLEAKRITSLQNVQSVEGQIAKLQQGGVLRQKNKSNWSIQGATTPSLDYDINDDDVVVPWDFDSAMMLTVYHHLEHAALFFDTLSPSGTSTSKDVGKLTCHYYPEITGDLHTPLQSTTYSASLDALIIPPQTSLDDAVPAYANRGAMTHEYAKILFNRYVDQGARSPRRLDPIWRTNPSGTLAYHELQALEVGLADFFAALDTNTPNPLDSSLAKGTTGRNLALTRYYERCLKFAAASGSYPSPSSCQGDYPRLICQGQSCQHQSVPTQRIDSRGVAFAYAEGRAFDPYHLGSVIASTLWTLRTQTALTDIEIGQALILAMKQSSLPKNSWRLAHFFHLMTSALPQSSRAQACGILERQLPALVSDQSLRCRGL